MAIQPYHYLPLRTATSTRVVRRHRSIHPGTLCYEIDQIDIEDPDRPLYRCISYTWGNPLAQSFGSSTKDGPDWSQSHIIHLYDSSGGLASLNVTTNLFHFLQELESSSAEDTQWIWIDAICINQTDLQERTAQVNHMGSVYLSCQEVIIWLGIEGPETRHAISLMASLDALPENAWKKWEGYPPAPGSGPVEDLVFDPVQDEEFEIWCLFFGRAWFQRVWTTQECVLPARGQLWCGNHHLPDASCFLRFSFYVYNRAMNFWCTRYILNTEKDLENAVLELRDVTWGISSFLGSRRPQAHRALFANSPRFSNISHAFVSMKRCMDPRDKFFGVLGLEENPTYTANYHTPPRDVIMHYVWNNMERENFFVTKQHNAFINQKDLPTWAPDLSSRGVPYPWVSFGGRKRFSAGTTGDWIIPVIHHKRDDHTITVEGFKDDEIVGLGGSYGECVEGSGLLQSFRMLQEYCSVDGSATGRPSVIETFWRTLVLDFDGPDREVLDKEFGKSFRNYTTISLAKWLAKAGTSRHEWSESRLLLASLDTMDTTRLLPEWNEVEEMVELIVQHSGSKSLQHLQHKTVRGALLFAEDLLWKFHYRRAFITRKGRIGVTTDTVQKGDLVYIVKGCEFPLIMKELSSTRLKFVNCSYVDGIMQGEALTDGVFESIDIE